MNKKLGIAYVIFCFNVIILLSTSFICTKAYPGDGDCRDYHKIEYINPHYEKDAIIQLDGLPNEYFWKYHSNEQENGSLIITLASKEGGLNQVVIYLNITFVITDKDLFILW